MFFIVSINLTAGLSPDLLTHTKASEMRTKGRKAKANERAQCWELGSADGVLLIKCNVEKSG